MFSQIKNYLLIGSIITIALLFSYSLILHKKYKNTTELYRIEANNYKAEIADNEKRIIQYKLTIDQFKYSKDSVDIKLDSVLKQLKIKDNKIRQLQYSLSIVQKKDTVVFTDTIFVDNFTRLDTTLMDKYYSLDLSLIYPSSIIVNPMFTLENAIIFSDKKETIKPPKWWLLRLFQKKHIVCEITVVEFNPYVTNKRKKFIEIIK